jgi:hypothetical protein
VSRISQRAFPIHIEWARLATIAVMAVGVYLIVGWVEHLSNGPVPWLASQIELATRGWDGSDLPALFRRIHTIVLEREMAMAALLVNATLASLYGLSVLALGPDARRYLWNIARRPAVLVGRAVMD